MRFALVLALGPEGVETNMVKGEDFGIQTVFTEGSFLSAGILEFPPQSTKPTRNSSKHALVRTPQLIMRPHP